MCRLKKHAYAELPPGENDASHAKNLHPNMHNSAFPRALCAFVLFTKIDV